MKKYLILFLTIFLLTGCSYKQTTKNLFYMDTLINIKIYSNDTKKVNEAIEYIDDLYKKYDNITNFYSDISELNKVNSNTTINISDELKELLNIGTYWYSKSNGKLNIAMGNITKIWHDFRNGLIDFPTDDELNKNIKIDSFILNGNTVINNGVKIDLGSITKGYVTQLAGNYLENIGLDKYIINAGGNVKVGNSPKGNYKIGVASPNKDGNIMIINGNNISVVTSGGYERFVEYNNTLYHHIISPETKKPANFMKSVTVIGGDSMLCDVLSTTLFLMSIEEGMNFIKDYDVDVIWYSNDDEIIKSEGFRYE